MLNKLISLFIFAAANAAVAVAATATAAAAVATAKATQVSKDMAACVRGASAKKKNLEEVALFAEENFEKEYKQERADDEKNFVSIHESETGFVLNNLDTDDAVSQLTQNITDAKK